MDFELDLNIMPIRGIFQGKLQERPLGTPRPLLDADMMASKLNSVRYEAKDNPVAIKLKADTIWAQWTPIEQKEESPESYRERVIRYQDHMRLQALNVEIKASRKLKEALEAVEALEHQMKMDKDHYETQIQHADRALGLKN